MLKLAFFTILFRLVPPSFLAGAVMTLTFFVVFSMLIKLFFSMNKLLEVWIGNPNVGFALHESFQTKANSK